MIIVVTGSSGFVGRRLVKRLKDLSHEIIHLDITSCTDVTKYDQLSDIKKFDLLFHLAAKTFVPDSFHHPREFYETNILGTLNALELCRKYNSRMIFVSSYVYGNPEYLPIDEKHTVSALNPYSQSKIIGEKLCESYHRDFGLNIIIIRPFNIYGPGQQIPFLIPTIISQAARGRITLKDPEPKRDYLYIDDAIDFYIKAAGFATNSMEIFNIGSGESYSVRNIVDIIHEMMHSTFEVSYANERRPGEIMDTIADISKAKSTFGWKPLTNIVDGIKNILDGME